jgi:hypothetical protein
MQNSKRHHFTFAFVGCLFLGLTLGCGSIKEMANSGQNASPANTAKPPSADRSPSTAERPAAKGGLTMAKFDRLEKGMTYAEVVEIIGSEGTKTGGMGDKEKTGFAIEIYKWTESGSDREITVFFKDEKLDTKFQFGLD